MIPSCARAAEVAEAAHVLSRLGLVTAYGHVSARIGGSMLITPADELATVTESAIVEVALAATRLPAAAPAEGWAHLAIYHARPDTAAIARAQPASALAASAVTTSLPVLPACGCCPQPATSSSPPRLPVRSHRFPLRRSRRGRPPEANCCRGCGSTCAAVLTSDCRGASHGGPTGWPTPGPGCPFPARAVWLRRWG